MTETYRQANMRKANAARSRRAEMKEADKLRSRGWTCMPPTDEIQAWIEGK